MVLYKGMSGLRDPTEEKPVRVPFLLSALAHLCSGITYLHNTDFEG
jgi:hypothetical protein